MLQKKEEIETSSHQNPFIFDTQRNRFFCAIHEIGINQVALNEICFLCKMSEKYTKNCYQNHFIFAKQKDFLCYP